MHSVWAMVRVAVSREGALERLHSNAEHHILARMYSNANSAKSALYIYAFGAG
jgi:hypothetical protein